MTPPSKPHYVTLSITLALIVALGLLARYLPVVAAILFICLTTGVAIATGRRHGFGRGFVVFIKEILFGW
jgi:hypothetical protein